jgi:divalent metal cation (Fe/Co/Zn/Cd) transporter
MRESVGGLMNETDDGVITQIAEAFEKERKSNPDWIDIHRFRYWKTGGKFMVDFHMIVPYYQNIKEAHDTTHKLEDLVDGVLEQEEAELLIHLDPCNPKCCFICNMPECGVRQEPKSKDVLWDGKKIISRAYYDIDEQP